MDNKLHFRKAFFEDLQDIISLLADDKLGKDRESQNSKLSEQYIKAFKEINADNNQCLMVVEKDHMIIATCHLTIIPSLTFCGSKRMQIEAVRVSSRFRGKGIGKSMFEKAIEYAKLRGASIVQLSTNKGRKDAYAFYQSLGFQNTHEGMKLYL